MTGSWRCPSIENSYHYTVGAFAQSRRDRAGAWRVSGCLRGGFLADENQVNKPDSVTTVQVYGQ